MEVYRIAFIFEVSTNKGYFKNLAVMYNYKFKFSNNNRGAKQFKNLDEAQAMAVTYMENHSTVNGCEIICPNGALSIVRKDGSWHWNHNGYSFSPVLSEQVTQYRKIQAARAV